MRGLLFGQLQQALALHHAGRLKEAEDGYRRVLAAEPRYAEAWHYLGVLLAQRGDHQAAVEAHAKALAIDGKAALVHFHLGESQRLLGRTDEALASYRRAIALKPDFGPAHDMYCATLAELGRFEASLAASARLVELAPQRPEGYCRRGNALLGLRENVGALEAFDRALALDPRNVMAWNGRGCALQALNRGGEAADAFRRAATLRPDFFDAFNNLATCLSLLGRYEEAVSAYRRALALNPAAAETQYNFGLALFEAGRLESAAAAFDEAVRLDPAHSLAATHGFFVRAQLCDWRMRSAEIADLKRRVDEGGRSAVFPLLAAFDDPALHLKAAKTMALEARPSAMQAGSAGARLRIAYLSADFHDHPVAHQIVELLERHDRARFEIFAVCLKAGPESAVRRRIKDAAEHFIEAGSRSDEEAAQSLAQAGIAIAVDLSGLTNAARPEILARRPAPLAVNYLGYPGTLGASHIDYILADDAVIPPDAECFYAEHIARLPHCFYPADTTRRTGAPASREAEGLPQDAFVFCAFGNAYKIAPEIFALWMRLLKKVEASVLWLSVGHQAARDNLRAEAGAHGIAPDRLIFAGRRADRAVHLARLALADLFLDTAPYGAHSTASDVLWMGVPVLTLAGRSFAARVAASQLAAIGAAELIAADMAGYESVALELARAPATLSELRGKLVRNRASHPLFDMAGLCRAVETAYETMWQRHGAGLAPQTFDVGRKTG